MIPVSQEYKDAVNATSRNVKALLRVCWDKQEALTAKWFRLDETKLDDGGLLTYEGYSQSENIAEIVGNWDKFVYKNEDTYVISAEGYEEYSGDRNQSVSADADVVITNSTDRFTPRIDRNLLVNPGFDHLDLDGWTIGSGVSNYTLTNDVSSGTAALYISKEILSGVSVSSDPVTVDANTGYTGSIFAKGTGSMNLAIVASGLQGDIASGLVAGQPLTSSYQRFEVGYITPSQISGTQTGYLRADLTGSAQGALSDSQFVENFTNTTYEDTANTSADWVTTSKKVILPRTTSGGSTDYGTRNSGYSLGNLVVQMLGNNTTNTWKMYFIAQANKTISKLHIFCYGKRPSTPIFNIGIQFDNGNNAPDGVWQSVTQGSFNTAWNEFNIPDFVITQDSKYWIVISYYSGTYGGDNYLYLESLYCQANYKSSQYALYLNPSHKPCFMLEYSDATTWGQPYAGYTVYGISGTSYYYNGQSFTPTEAKQLTNIKFLLKRQNVPSGCPYGDIFVKIVNHATSEVVYDEEFAHLSNFPSVAFWYEVSHNLSLDLTAGTRYDILLYDDTDYLSYGTNYAYEFLRPTAKTGESYGGGDTFTVYGNTLPVSDLADTDCAFQLTYSSTAEQYSTSASVQSLTTDTSSDPIHRATLIPAETASGNAIVNYFLSNDGGSNWLPAGSGVEVTFNQLNSDLRWKANLNTDDQTITPEIKTVVINYTHGSSGAEMTIDNACLSQGETADFDQNFVGDKILPKRPTKIIIDVGGKTIQKFTGVTETIEPDIGNDTVSMHFYDFSKELEQQQVTTAMYRDLNTASGIMILAGEAGISSGTWVIEPGRHTIPFLWFQEGSIWYYMQQLAEAEGGRVFFDEDGVLNFWNRDHYLGSGTSSESFDFSEMTDLRWRIDKDEIKNHIIVKASPRTVQTRQLVYTHGTYEEIKSGETKEVWVRFEDVDRNNEGLPCMGVELPPVNGSATTSSYKAYTNSDGTGSDVTSSVIVSSYYGFAESARINFRNNSGATAYITTLTIWAAPATAVDIFEEAEDSDSITIYGDQVLQIENNLINSRNIAKSLAYQRLEELKNPRTHLHSSMIGKPYLQVGDIIQVQDSYLDSLGSGTYQNLIIKNNRWQVTDEFTQTIEFEKREVAPWFILDNSTLDSSYQLFV